MKKIPVFIMLFLLFSSVVRSASLSLTKIGALETEGKNYAEWWYTGENPKLVGTAAPSSPITISVNGEDFSVSADSAGNWSFLGALPTGDYNIVITSGAESYKFLLHTGQGMPSTKQSETSPANAVPETGSIAPFIILFSSVLVSFGLYLGIQDRFAYKKVIEKDLF